MASFVQSYGIESFKPKKYWRLSDFQKVLNDYRMHSASSKRQSKKPGFELLRQTTVCPNCEQEYVQVSLMQTCSRCDVSYRGAIEKRSEMSEFETLLVKQFSTKPRGESSMKSLTFETGRFCFSSGVTGGAVNIVTVPGLIFWQTGFFLKLQKLVMALVRLQPVTDSDSIMSDERFVRLLSLNKPLKSTPKQKSALAICHMNQKDCFFNGELLLKIRFALGVMYLNLQEEELNYGSIASNRKGKYSWARQVVDSRRSKCTARAVISPANHIESSSISLPFSMYRDLLKPQACYVLINRMPSLLSCNITGHCVTYVNKNETIGMPTSVLKGHGADFDGDAVSVYYPEDLASQIEIHMLMNSRTLIDCHSTNSGMKLHPTNDQSRALKLVMQKPLVFPELTEELTELLEPLDIKFFSDCEPLTIAIVVRSLFGDLTASRLFAFMTRALRTVSVAIPHSFEYRDLKNLAELSDLETRKVDLSLDAPSLVPLTNERVTEDHLMQIVHALGEQHFPSFLKKEQQLCSYGHIKGNLLLGLSTVEQLFHSQSGFCNVVASTLDVSANGYASNKRASVFQDCYVDHQHFLRERNVIICRKASQYTLPSDVFPPTVVNAVLSL